jgi:hypothetical protein
MESMPRRLICCLLASLSLGGCASFEPGMRLQALNQPRQPTARFAQDGLEVSVEEFITPEKSQKMFDTNLASSRVLPIFVRVENSGGEKFSLRSSDIKASLKGQPLNQLAPKDAADQAATSEYVGKALGWTLATGPFAILLWPVTMGASAVHTRGVNKRIEAYFDGTSYQDALVSPRQNTFGFVYFKIEDKMDRLDGLVIEAEATGDQSGKKLSYKFPLPPIQMSK